MDLAKYIAFVISVLETFAEKTESQLDDQALSLLRALANSPDMLLWLEQWLPGQQDIPAGAMTAENLKLPPGARAIAVSPDQLAKLVQVLAFLAELWRQFKPAALQAPAPGAPTSTGTAPQAVASRAPGGPPVA